MTDRSSPLPVPGEPAVAGEHRRVWFMVVLSALMAFNSIATDLYLPAVPAMARALGASAGTVEWTIGSYLIGFSLGQGIWGPFSDRHGRKWPVTGGLLLFCLGSAGCAMAPAEGTLIVFRIVQAVGASASVVLARAMVRDLYPGQAAQMLSTLISIMMIAPLVGPLLGGQILRHAGWRDVFWVITGCGVVGLLASLTLPESLPAGRRKSSSLGHAFAGYGALLRDSRVIGYASAGGFMFLGAYAYVSASPDVYEAWYGVSPQDYGFLFGSSILGIIAANMMNAWLVSRIGSDRLLRLGAIIAAASGIWVGIAGWTGGGLFVLAAGMLVYFATQGLIVANSLAGSLHRHPDRAGSASALVGALQYAFGIAGSGLVALFADGTPRPMGCVVAIGGALCLLCATVLIP